MPRLLLIDDDQLLLVSVAERLRAAGYDVHTTPSCEDGLQMDLDSFDAVVCDFTFPGMNGAAFLRTLREQRHSRVPFIFITGTREPDELVRDAVRFDAEFLPKPVRIRDLLDLLAERLAR
jgi:DNA-binding response OmpR family regulator